jgi:hypothetical protein
MSVEESEPFMNSMEFGIIGFTSWAQVTVVMVELLVGTMFNTVGGCQDPYFHTLTNGRQYNVSLILLCSSGLALGLRPLLSSPARAILTGIQNVSAVLPFFLISRFLVGSSRFFRSLVSLSVVLWYSMEACWMVLGPGDLVHSMDESSV